jgi:hypothetical protein
MLPTRSGSSPWTLLVVLKPQRARRSGRIQSGRPENGGYEALNARRSRPAFPAKPIRIGAWALRRDLEAYMRSEVSERALSLDFAVKVICYGYGRADLGSPTSSKSITACPPGPT